MCEILHENGGKCCGECDRQEELAVQRCDTCLNFHTVDQLTKDWQESGWDVCDNCIGDGNAMKALAGDVATSSDPHTKLIANSFIRMIEAEQAASY